MNDLPLEEKQRLVGAFAWLIQEDKKQTLHFISLKKKNKMIDTICLLIAKEKMTYIDGVSNWELFSKTDQYASLFVILVKQKKKLENISKIDWL